MIKRNRPDTRLRFGLLAVLAALALLLAPPAFSQAFGDDIPVYDGESAGGGLLSRFFGGGNDALLPPEEAFPASFDTVGDDVVIARWDTAEGYYLYRERLDFRVDGNGITGYELPDGRKVDDPNFGEMEVYYGPLEVYIQLDRPVASGDTLTVDYQGCADTGLCYPPQSSTFDLADGTSVAGFAGGAGTPGTGAPLDNLLASGNVWAVLGAFFLAGLALAFTACMYPLIPILSGLVAGDARRSSGRAFMLSLVFVQATAVTYALAGAGAGMTGAAIQAYLQSPIILGAFAAVFVAMAFAMFGLYNVQIPAGMQTLLNGVARRQRGGNFIGAGVLGVLSALIVGACSGPALIAALVFISNTGDAWLGGAALFAMANGMGLPLLLVGTAFGRWLPRSGPWMIRMKQAFGFVFLGVALWMIARFLPGPVMLALWAMLAISAALWLGLADRLQTSPLFLRSRQAAAGVLGLWAGLLLIGAAAGGSSIWQPLAPLTHPDAGDRPTVAWESVESAGELDDLLQRAAASNRPVMIDVYADWCVYCVQLEQDTFRNPEVIRAVDAAIPVKVDVTAMNQRDRELLRYLDVFLPPAVIFVDGRGTEHRDERVVGFMGPEEFVGIAERTLQPAAEGETL